MSDAHFDMNTMPLRKGHYWVLLVASLGQLVGAALATLVGIILPLIQINLHPELTSIEQGMVCCTSLIGIMVGSFLFGNLSDEYGYLFFFRLCPCIVLVASLLVFFTDGLLGLVVGLFFMGLGAGGEYSLDGDYISEIMPRRWCLFMVGVAKAMCSIGNILMATICYLFLSMDKSPDIWNKLVLVISAIALLMLLLRIRFAQSPGWLIARGRVEEAQQAVRFFLGNDVDMGDKAIVPQKTNLPQETWRMLFTREKLPKVVFSGIPWACSGLGVYGIGIFLPILIMALGMESTSLQPLEHVVDSVKNTALISLFIFIGFAAGLFWIDKINHVKLQAWGFLLSATGLGVLLLAYMLRLPMWIAIAGFMFFEFFLNAGPNLVTYIIPPQIYSVHDRGLGAGLAAAFGKVGAVLAVLFMPILLHWGGIKLALFVSIAVLVIGGVITYVVGRKVLPPVQK